jgi:RHS repeat-associated protein
MLIPGSAPEIAPLGAPLITTHRVISYTYDSLYRLITATYSSGESYRYTYDAVGNRQSLTTHEDVVNYQYDAANRLTSVNGQTYNWDDNGNLLSDGLRSYAYDHANRLTQVVSGTLTTQFTYNGAGDRVAKTVDGLTTEYVLDPAAGLTQVLQETTDGQATSYLYGHDGSTALTTGLLAQYDSGTWAYHVNDGLGSVRQLADPTGQVVQGYSFSPFGVPLGESGGEPYGFTGEQWDASAGLVFLRARYYNPSLGIFTSKDPLAGDPRRPQTFNGYMYANQNPLRYRDPSGYDGEDVTEFLMGVVYQWIANNYDALGISAKSQLRAGAEEVAEQHRYSVPFQIGRFTGSMIGIGQAIWEVGAGVGIMGCGGVGELTTGWTGVGAVASGGVVAVGAAVTAHGVVVGVVSAAHMGDIAGNIYWAVAEGGGGGSEGTGPDVALGLSILPEGAEGRPLWKFADQTGAKAFPDWEESRLSGPTFPNFPEAFESAMSKTKHIHFNLDGIDDVNAALQQGAQGWGARNMTNTELYLIVNNSTWFNKTTFYRNGVPLSIAEVMRLFGGP